jgi:hypothetical protein
VKTSSLLIIAFSALCGCELIGGIEARRLVRANVGGTSAGGTGNASGESGESGESGSAANSGNTSGGATNASGGATSTGGTGATSSGGTGATTSTGGVGETGGGAGTPSTGGIGGTPSTGGAGGTPTGGTAGDAGAGGAPTPGITRVGSNTNFPVVSSSIAVDLALYSGGFPTSGDWAFVALYVGNGEDQDADLIDDHGWTMTGRLVGTACGSFGVWYGYRFVAEGDPTRYTFTFDVPAIVDPMAAVVVYRGVSTEDPFAGEGAQARGFGTNDFSVPSIVTPVPGTTVLVVFANGFNWGGQWRPPDGMDELFDTGVLGGFERVMRSGGTFPTGSATPDTGGCGTMFVAALQPSD